MVDSFDADTQRSTTESHKSGLPRLFVRICQYLLSNKVTKPLVVLTPGLDSPIDSPITEQVAPLLRAIHADLGLELHIP